MKLFGWQLDFFFFFLLFWNDYPVSVFSQECGSKTSDLSFRCIWIKHFLLPKLVHLLSLFRSGERWNHPGGHIWVKVVMLHYRILKVLHSVVLHTATYLPQTIFTLFTFGFVKNKIIPFSRPKLFREWFDLTTPMVSDVVSLLHPSKHNIQGFTSRCRHCWIYIVFNVFFLLVEKLVYYICTTIKQCCKYSSQHIRKYCISTILSYFYFSSYIFCNFTL